MITLLSSEILIADKLVRDDAFVFWMKGYMETKDVLFEFDELWFTLKMLKQKGFINKEKTYIQLTYDWDGEECFLNVSDTFDKLNLKYVFYPPYLLNRILYQ